MLHGVTRFADTDMGAAATGRDSVQGQAGCGQVGDCGAGDQLRPRRGGPNRGRVKRAYHARPPLRPNNGSAARESEEDDDGPAQPDHVVVSEATDPLPNLRPRHGRDPVDHQTASFV